MPYKASHAAELTTHLKKLKPGDFIMVSNGLATGNVTFSNIDNAAIRLASLSAYGHAMIYLGNEKAMELPIAYGKVSSIFHADKTNGAAFVHCKKLTTKQRERIVQVAQLYYNKKKGEELDYDLVGFALGGAATVLSSAADLASGALMSDEWVGRLADDVLQTPAVAYNSLFAVLNKYPDLNCASLVTYLHAAVGHIINPGWLKHPTYSTPRNLWDAARKSKTRFSVTELSFD